MSSKSAIVELSPLKFLAGCAVLAAGLFALGMNHPFPPWAVALEVLVTILALFVFGSIRYRLDKNALTYGAALVIVATFWNGWWESSALRADVQRTGLPRARGIRAPEFLHPSWLGPIGPRRHHALHPGVDVLRRRHRPNPPLGNVELRRVGQDQRTASVPTVAALTALVAFASGILDGVSMIGLMIRTLVILLFLAKVKEDTVIFAVMVSTVVTTVCGMWLAYGEPPNLIMKANLHPHLDNAFFLRYLPPGGGGELPHRFLERERRLRAGNASTWPNWTFWTATRPTCASCRRDARRSADPRGIPEAHAADRRGSSRPGVRTAPSRRARSGEALVNEHVPRETSIGIYGRVLASRLAVTLDDYYVHVFGLNDHKADKSAEAASTGPWTAWADKTPRPTDRRAFLPPLRWVPDRPRLEPRGPALLWPPSPDSRRPFSASAAPQDAAPWRCAKPGTNSGIPVPAAALPLDHPAAEDRAFRAVPSSSRPELNAWGLARGLRPSFGSPRSSPPSWTITSWPISPAAPCIGLDARSSISSPWPKSPATPWADVGRTSAPPNRSSPTPSSRRGSTRYTPFQWIKAMTPVVLQIMVFMTALIYIEGRLLR